MKMTELSKMVKRNGIIRVFDTGNGKVIFTQGNALFAVDSVPLLESPEQVRVIMDIPRKKWEEIHCQIKKVPLRNVDGINMDAGDDSEIVLQETPIQPLDCKTMVADDGSLFFYDQALLAPIKDLLKEDVGYGSFCKRHMKNGTPYMVVKDGLEVVAAVLPLKGAVNKDFLQAIAEYQSLALAEFERNGESQ